MPLPYEFALHFITLLTVTLQFYIFYLVKTQSPRSMINYKFFLNYFTLWDLCFTIILGVFLQPDPIGKNVSVRVIGLAYYIGPKAQIICVSLLIYTAFNVLLSQIYCLFYRFSAIHGNKKFQQFFVSNNAKVLCIFIGQTGAICICILSFYIFVPPENFNANYFTGTQLENYSKYIEPGEFVIWVDESLKAPKIFLSIIFSFFVTSELLSVFLIYQILSILKRNTKNFSKNTLKLHFQLTILLIIQLLLPLVLIILPVSIRWIRALLDYDESSTINRIRIVIISTYGLINGMFTVLIVAPFRSHAYNTLVYPWLRPVLVVARLEHLTPRRKSNAWVTGGVTRPGAINPTTVRSSIVGSWE